MRDLDIPEIILLNDVICFQIIIKGNVNYFCCDSDKCMNCLN